MTFQRLSSICFLSTVSVAAQLGLRPCVCACVHVCLHAWVWSKHILGAGIKNCISFTWSSLTVKTTSMGKIWGKQKGCNVMRPHWESSNGSNSAENHRISVWIIWFTFMLEDFTQPGHVWCLKWSCKLWENALMHLTHMEICGHLDLLGGKGRCAVLGAE